MCFILFLVLFLVGCTNNVQISENQREQVQEDSITKSEKSQPITEETRLANITPPGQKSAVNETQKEQKCSREFSPQFNAGPYYTGNLFDAHFHMPPAFEELDDGFRFPVLGKEITLSQILCYFDKEKVNGANAFYFPDYENLEKAIGDAAEMKKQLPEGVRLFLMPAELLAEELDVILNSNPNVFDGFGEIVFYDPERAGATPDDPISLEIYKVAAKHKIIVMFHPGENQKIKVEKALQQNPNVKFLLHGFESEDYISELMDKYPNVYYSVDSATLYHFDGMFMSGPKANFVSRFKRDFDSILNSKVSKWKDQIEKHPDRFMWGTDRSADWHYNEEISILFEEFARAFIGRLDSIVQEKYAYRNAENLFK